jgi:hypothetical protein
LTAWDFPSLISYTATGQVSLHVPHPSHLLTSILISTIFGGISFSEEFYQNKYRGIKAFTQDFDGFEDVMVYQI